MISIKKKLLVIFALTVASTQIVESRGGHGGHRGGRHHSYRSGRSWGGRGYHGWGYGGLGLGLGLGLSSPYWNYPYYSSTTYYDNSQLAASYARRKAINAQILQLQQEFTYMKEQLDEILSNGANPNSDEVKTHKRKMENHQQRINQLQDQLATA